MLLLFYLQLQQQLSTNDHELIETYVNQAFRYVTIIVLPTSLGITVFATPLISLLFPAYAAGASALQILSLGMLFFTLYTISASISQGMGKPIIPMVSLGLGVAIELGLSLYLVPIYGINGAAVATTIATFVLMVTVAWRTLKHVKVRLQFVDLGKIAIASAIMTIILLFIPTTYAYTTAYANTSHIVAIILTFIYILIIALIGSLIYIGVLTLIGGVKKSDVTALFKLANRVGPLAPVLNTLGSFLMRFAK